MQLYAMNSDNLENVEYTQEGRGFAFREDGNRQRGLTVPFLTIIHILINVVFALSVTYFLHKYHGELNQVKGKQYQLVASMYWSVVFLCLIGAVVIITGNCYLYYALLFIDDQSLGVFGFRIVSDITVAIIVAVEFLVAMVTPHDPGFFIPHLIRRTLCCNQWCHCCGSHTGLKILRRFILGIAMWVIMVFLQLVVASLLPLAVVIITNPVPTLAYVSIMVALFFCLVVFVAYFLNAFEGNYISRHRLTREERHKSSIGLSTFARDASLAGNWIRDKLILVTQAFVFLVIFVIVALVVILYLNFVRAGANTNTAGGLFFSLIPSALLGGIAWAAKKHLFKELEEEEEEGKKEGKGAAKKGEEVEETVFKIGGISWQRRSTRRRRKEPVIVLSNGAASDNVEIYQDTVIEMEPQEDNTQAGDSKEEERNEDMDMNYTSSSNLLEKMSEQAQAEQDGKVKGEQVKTDQDGKTNGKTDHNGEAKETDQDGEPKGEQVKTDQDGKVKGEQTKIDQDGKVKGEQAETDQDGKVKGEQAEIDQDGKAKGEQAKTDQDSEKKGEQVESDQEDEASGGDSNVTKLLEKKPERRGNKKSAKPSCMSMDIQEIIVPFFGDDMQGDDTENTNP